MADKTGSLTGVKRHDYRPFGEEMGAAENGRGGVPGYAGADSLRQHFTGYERDAETMLDFAQARYYASAQGRFTSVDPLLASGHGSSPQTWNRYSYGLNNLLRNVDPSGLYPNELANGPGVGNSHDSEEEHRQLVQAVHQAFIEQQEANRALAEAVDAAGRGNFLEAAMTMASASTNTEPQNVEADTRAQFPTFNQADLGVVNQAIGDAREATDPYSTFSLILGIEFRSAASPAGMTPRKATNELDASSGLPVNRDSQGRFQSFGEIKQNVFDGRTSTLLVPDGGRMVPIASYFSNHQGVNAITYAGVIFVGQGFFNQG